MRLLSSPPHHGEQRPPQGQAQCATPRPHLDRSALISASIRNLSFFLPFDLCLLSLFCWKFLFFPNSKDGGVTRLGPWTSFHLSLVDLKCNGFNVIDSLSVPKLIISRSNLSLIPRLIYPATSVTIPYIYRIWISNLTSPKPNSWFHTLPTPLTSHSP